MYACIVHIYAAAWPRHRKTLYCMGTVPFRHEFPPSPTKICWTNAWRENLQVRAIRTHSYVTYIVDISRLLLTKISTRYHISYTTQAQQSSPLQRYLLYVLHPKKKCAKCGEVLLRYRRMTTRGPRVNGQRSALFGAIYRPWKSDAFAPHNNRKVMKTKTFLVGLLSILQHYQGPHKSSY